MHDLNVEQGGRVVFDGGAVGLPREPGLGVELDHDALAKLHRNYLASGLELRDDAAEMRKLNPAWQVKLTRW